MSTKPTKIVRTSEQQSRANEMFDDLRDELLKRELSNTENYDKSILTLSSAALGISLTAMKFVVPLDGAEYICLVKWGWLFLLFSIITSLIAFFMSNKAISIQLKNAEEYYSDGLAEAFNRPNIFTTINSIVNKITGVMFIAGISAIVAFILINIDSENTKMTKDIKTTKTTTVIRQDSANIPVMSKAPSGDDLLIKSANIPTMQSAPGTQTTTQGTDTNNSSNANSTSGKDSSSDGSLKE